MAGLFGIDGPVAVFFLTLIFYGGPIVTSIIINNYYPIAGIFGIFILVTLYTLVTNSNKYLFYN